jgi:hypothetical protein
VNNALEDMAAILNAITEVAGAQWDRCTRSDEHCTAFGWIFRDDDLADFVIVRFADEGVWWATSSAKYSREISKRLLGTDATHHDCERVSGVFGSLVNKATALRTEGV